MWRNYISNVRMEGVTNEASPYGVGGVASRMRRLASSCALLLLKQLSWMPGLGDRWETLKRREVEIRQCKYATICHSKM